jgi:hypothetical protein
MSTIFRNGLVSLSREHLCVPRRSRAEHSTMNRILVSPSKTNIIHLTRRPASGARPKLDTSAFNQTIGPYGLRRVDYSKPPSPWPRPPPPPASKQKTERYFPFVIAIITVVGGFWIYFNQDEQVYDYWRQVETGNVPLDDLDDEEEDEDEWEVRK